MNKCNRQEVYIAIDQERDHQDRKWGPNKQQSLAGFLLVMRKELDEAEMGWMKDETGRHSPLHEIRQIAATAVACMERYGTEGNTICTDDIST